LTQVFTLVLNLIGNRAEIDSGIFFVHRIYFVTSPGFPQLHIRSLAIVISSQLYISADQVNSTCCIHEALDTQVPCTYTRLSEKQGLIPDAHLIASLALSKHTFLWTRDKRLAALAEKLGMAFNETEYHS